MTGRVHRTFHDYAFIVRDDDQHSVFFHQHDVAGVRFRDLVVGDAVSFDVKRDGVERERAFNVRRLDVQYQGA